MIENFLTKRPTDYKPNYFWIVSVHGWIKTSLAIAAPPLTTLNCFKCYRYR